MRPSVDRETGNAALGADIPLCLQLWKMRHGRGCLSGRRSPFRLSEFQGPASRLPVVRGEQGRRTQLNVGLTLRQSRTHPGGSRRSRLLHRLVAGSPEERQPRDLHGCLLRAARRRLSAQAPAGAKSGRRIGGLFCPRAGSRVLLSNTLVSARFSPHPDDGAQC